MYVYAHVCVRMFGTLAFRPAQAMKTRANVATCRLSDKLIDAYRIMFESRQNCVLVVEGLGDVDGENVLDPDDQGSHIHGVITVADALRTFSECQSGDNIMVKGFLNGLTAAEHFTAPGRSILDTQSLLEAAELMSDARPERALCHPVDSGRLHGEAF